MSEPKRKDILKDAGDFNWPSGGFRTWATRGVSGGPIEHFVGASTADPRHWVFKAKFFEAFTALFPEPDERLDLGWTGYGIHSLPRAIFSGASFMPRVAGVPPFDKTIIMEANLTSTGLDTPEATAYVAGGYLFDDVSYVFAQCELDTTYNVGKREAKITIRKASSSGAPFFQNNLSSKVERAVYCINRYDDIMGLLSSQKYEEAYRKHRVLKVHAHGYRGQQDGFKWLHDDVTNKMMWLVKDRLVIDWKGRAGPAGNTLDDRPRAKMLRNTFKHIEKRFNLRPSAYRSRQYSIENNDTNFAESLIAAEMRSSRKATYPNYCSSDSPEKIAKFMYGCDTYREGVGGFPNPQVQFSVCVDRAKCDQTFSTSHEEILLNRMSRMGVKEEILAEVRRQFHPIYVYKSDIAGETGSRFSHNPWGKRPGALDFSPAHLQYLRTMAADAGNTSGHLGTSEVADMIGSEHQMEATLVGIPRYYTKYASEMGVIVDIDDFLRWIIDTAAGPVTNRVVRPTLDSDKPVNLRWNTDRELDRINRRGAVITASGLLEVIHQVKLGFCPYLRCCGTGDDRKWTFWRGPNSEVNWGSRDAMEKFMSSSYPTPHGRFTIEPKHTAFIVLQRDDGSILVCHDLVNWVVGFFCPEHGYDSPRRVFGESGYYFRNFVYADNPGVLTAIELARAKCYDVYNRKLDMDNDPNVVPSYDDVVRWSRGNPEPMIPFNVSIYLLPGATPQNIALVMAILDPGRLTWDKKVQYERIPRELEQSMFAVLENEQLGSVPSYVGF